MPVAEIMEYFRENPDQLLFQQCDGKFHPGSVYKTFSELPSTCRAEILCKEVHTPPLDLLVLDINFFQVPVDTDSFKIEPEQCFYRNHVVFNATADGMTMRYHKCGWNGKFW